MAEAVLVEPVSWPNSLVRETVRYLGIEVDDAFAIAEQVNA